MADNPHATRRVCVTVKVPESKRYANDNPWLVFEAETVEDARSLVAEATGVEVEGLTLLDVTINAQRAVSGLSAAAHGLGGKVLSNSAAEAPKAPENGSGDVWTQARQSEPEPAQEPQEEEEKTDPILAALENCKTVAEVQQVWAENQSAFNSNPDYMAAYKARGKALR